MTPLTSRRNSGPAKAEENRAALVAAGRRVFVEQGYRAPFSAVAREAGVSQAVLYRHFPDRRSLALEVFSENFDAMERIAISDAGPGAFFAVWRRLVEEVIESTAIIEFVVAEGVAVPVELGPLRVDEVLGEPLARAQVAGLVDPGWTMSDIMLIARMLHGAVSTQPDRESARRAATRALELIDPRLAQSCQC